MARPGQPLPRCLMPHLPEKRAFLFELEKHFQFQVRRAGWLVVGLALGCAPVALPDGERRVALQTVTDQVIVPTYTDLSARASELSSLLEELAVAPEDADLAAIRQAYLEVRAPLEEAAAFGFGPAAELRSVAALDQIPIDTAKIDAELASDTELTPAHLRSLGANKRGLHAIEYLLFPAEDAELEAALLANGTEGERRRQFASVAGQLVADSADELYAAWAPEIGNYAGHFARPGEPDSVSSTVQTGLDTLLNETVVLSETVADVKLGKPLGTATGGAVDPAAQESERSGASIADMLGNLRGARNIYFGTRDGSVGPSLASLVRAKSPSTDLRARAALAEAEAALHTIPEPFTEALTESPELVSAAYDSVKTLKRVLATEVLSSLGASLKFSDNDGD
jgi:predicted lipoprotein